MRYFAALAVILLASASASHAKMGRCLLQVHGKTYLTGHCNVVIEDKDGSFSIGTEQKRRLKHFAYVLMRPGGAQGYWNEEADGTHAHDDLGFLKRDGACWKNAMAKVCAFR